MRAARLAFLDTDAVRRRAHAELLRHVQLKCITIVPFARDSLYYGNNYWGPRPRTSWGRTFASRLLLGTHDFATFISRMVAAGVCSVVFVRAAVPYKALLAVSGTRFAAAATPFASGWHMPEVPLVLPRDKPSTATVRMTALAFLMTTSACSVAALTFGALSATVQLLLIVLIAVMLLGSAHQCVPLPLWKCMLYLFASSALYVDVSALDYLYTSECVVDGPQFSYAYYLSASSVVSSIFGACAAILFQPKLQGFSFRQCVALWDGRQVRGVVGRHYAGEPVERWPR